MQIEMKQFFIMLMLAIVASVFTTKLNAQENDTTQNVQNVQNVPETLAPETPETPKTVQNSPSTGDLFNGLTRPLTFNRMIPPYALEITFYKTVHIIFPAGIRYVDLGSIDLLAAKADGAENVLRVKAATQGFSKESNLSVITEDGSYYTFNVKYSDEPVKLSVEMADFLHLGSAINRPGNEIPVYLSDLGGESPYLVRLIMETIHKQNKTKIKHIGSRNFGISSRLFFILGNCFLQNRHFDSRSVPFVKPYFIFFHLFNTLY
jgi:conjugative transposon TraN protein